MGDAGSLPRPGRSRRLGRAITWFSSTGRSGCPHGSSGAAADAANCPLDALPLPPLRHCGARFGGGRQPSVSARWSSRLRSPPTESSSRPECRAFARPRATARSAAYDGVPRQSRAWREAADKPRWKLPVDRRAASEHHFSGRPGQLAFVAEWCFTPGLSPGHAADGGFRHGCHITTVTKAARRQSSYRPLPPLRFSPVSPPVTTRFRQRCVVSVRVVTGDVEYPTGRWWLSLKSTVATRCP